MLKYLLLIILILSFLIQPALADNGLVQCGKDEPNCELIDLFQMLKTIMDWLMVYGGIFATLFIAGGGIMMIISRGNEANIAKARLWITNAVIGLLIIFIAWAIINTIMIILGATHWTNWWKPLAW